MKIKKIVLIIVSVIGMIVLSGCGPYENGEDGVDGGVGVTFYYDETDVIAIDTSELTSDEAKKQSGYFVGADCINSVYFGVSKLNGSFSWTTSDGMIHAQGVAFTADKGTKGEKGHPPQNPGEFFNITDNFGSVRGEDGDSGDHKYYVIQLQGATATIFNNTPSYGRSCPLST